MGIVASAQGGQQKDFEKVSDMIQQAVLADVVDKGDVQVTYAGKTKTVHKAYFVWILEELDSEGRNKRAFDSFAVSLNKSKQGKESNLRKRLKEFGAVFTIDPATKKDLIDGKEGVDLDKYIGTKRTLVMSLEDSSTPGGDPFLKILATQKPSGSGVEIPADFVRKQDKQ
jgi:hypothetical protein